MRRISLVLFFIATILVLSIGAYHYQQKISSANKEAREYNQELAKKQADTKAKEEKKVRELLSKGAGHTIQYLALGDSITEGYYASAKNKTYVQLLGSYLKDRMGFDVEINQHGLAGAKLEWGLGEVANVKKENPDIVTIEFGTNDADPKKNPTDLNLFESQLNDLIDELTANEGKKPEIVLITTWRMFEYGDPYDVIIKRVGEERNIPVADMSSIYKDNSNVGPEGRETYLGKGDIYHPNDQGMKNMSEAIYQKIQPLVIKLVDEKKL